MSKRIDLTGQVFGDLTVLSLDSVTSSGKTKWLCKCKCGNEIVVLSDSLRHGKTTSCGCKVRKLKHDLTGQTVGYLKVLKPVSNPHVKGNETRWQCLCQNCGRTVEVSSWQLRHSNPYGHCVCTRWREKLKDLPPYE